MMTSPLHQWMTRLFFSRTSQPHSRVGVALLLAGLLPISLYAEVTLALPRSATITDLQPTSGSHVPFYRADLTQGTQPARRNQVIQLNYQNHIPRQSMIVSNRGSSRANVRLDDPSDIILQIGPSQQRTEYLFPCAMRGNGIVGWNAIARHQRGCSSFVAQSSQSATQAFLPTVAEVSLAINPATRTEVNMKQVDPMIQTASSELEYCGAIASSGTAWGFSYAVAGTDHPCVAAIAECESAGGQCVIASAGYVPIQAPELFASAQCPGILGLTTKGSGQVMLNSELNLLKDMARSLRGVSCQFNVYQPGDLIISPATDALTLVQIQETRLGNMEVQALVGAIRVVSAARPRGLDLPEGFRYQSGLDTPEPANCASAFASESMQTFLSPGSWGGATDITDRLVQYQKEFCQNSLEEPNRPSRPDFGFEFNFPFPGLGGNGTGGQPYPCPPGTAACRPVP